MFLILSVAKKLSYDDDRDKTIKPVRVYELKFTLTFNVYYYIKKRLPAFSKCSILTHRLKMFYGITILRFGWGDKLIMKRYFLFESALQGFLYIFLLVCSPIVPAVLELIIHDAGLDFFASLLVSCFVVFYEYIGLFTHGEVCTRIWYERIIGVVVCLILGAFVIVNVFYFCYSRKLPLYGTEDYIFCSLLAVFIIIGIIELICTLRAEHAKQVAKKDDMASIVVSGAFKV